MRDVKLIRIDIILIMRNLMKKAIIALSFLLATSCASLTKDELRVTQAGVPYMLHLNYMDAPCPEIAIDTACVTWNSYGLAHVWMNELAPYYVLEHEEGHVNGMIHTNWFRTSIYAEPCSIVTKADIENKYPVGTTICVSKTGERKIKKAD